MFGLIHPIKYSCKLIVNNPKQFLTELIEDLQKDRSAKKFYSRHYLVWCCGLPKSGTTLIENILNTLPYVQINMSAIRRYSEKGLNHPHGIKSSMVKFAPKNKYSFIKTHTHFSHEYLNTVASNNAKIIISLRDLRNMMISNYYYMANNPRHWAYDKIDRNNFKIGFQESLMLRDKITNQTALEYYYNWIINWKKYAKKNRFLTLWHEDYLTDQINYIDKILEYLNFEEFNSHNIERKLASERDKSGNLNLNLKNPGRKMSTFSNMDKIDFSNIFDKETEDFFNLNLPGPLDLVLK